MAWHKKYSWRVRLYAGICIVFFLLACWSVFGSIWLDLRWLPTGIAAAALVAVFNGAFDKQKDKEDKERADANPDQQ